MREIVFDTETTGLEPGEHRVVEIGALELENHVATGRTFHRYINPRRPMPPDAFAIHGISDSDLKDKPFFEDIAAEFEAFFAGAVLVAHNANFDMGFLNFELEKAGRSRLSGKVVDTLQIARKKYPGAQNSLDALCRRFGVDTSKRVKHGALLDSELLAEVYLELKGGRQSALLLDPRAARGAALGGDGRFAPAKTRPSPRPVLITEDERKAHAAFVETLGENALWALKKDEPVSPS